MRVWFRALVAVAPLVVVLGAGGAAQAGSAAAPQISPADGSVITASSVTIRVKSAPGGGTLYVDGVPVATGKNRVLQYTINGRTEPNGTHRVRLSATSGLPWDAASSTFRMAVPASAPSGVTASAKGNKVTVRWQKGDEPDLTGYTLSGDLGSRSVSAGSCGAQCSVTLTAPASANGQATIQVAAKRSGAAPSGATTRTVRLKGTAAQPQAPGNGNAPQGPGSSNYTPPPNPQNPLFPTVAPNPPGFSTEDPEVSMVYPTPTDPAVLDPSVVSMDNTGLTNTLADESLQWGKSVAIALVLLLCAAHLGAWTRRLRTVKATGPGGLRVVPGSAHARVEANRLHIEAALVAAKGVPAEDPSPEEGRKSRRLKKRKRGPANPEPVEPDLGSVVQTADPEQDFPDELNLEYTPKRLDPADVPAAAPDPVAGLDETNVDLGTNETADEDEPDPDRTILDGTPESPEGVRKPDEDGTDAALAALVELAKADAPAQSPEPAEEASDRTEVLEHPRRRRGLFRR
ncbi:hypothetical protein [Actinocorallia populi]|uniref:hypothetical protein n=1 Tax=Actinocorallia populi TaxID=2079200 RepID=UPI0013009FC6|nr:hypothetical protein [Actinocorallia populi]